MNQCKLVSLCNRARKRPFQCLGCTRLPTHKLDRRMWYLTYASKCFCPISQKFSKSFACLGVACFPDKLLSHWSAGCGDSIAVSLTFDLIMFSSTHLADGVMSYREFAGWLSWELSGNTSLLSCFIAWDRTGKNAGSYPGILLLASPQLFWYLYEHLICLIQSHWMNVAAWNAANKSSHFTEKMDILR